MRWSSFGRKFTQTSGTLKLMEDLGEAFASEREMINLGGGNPSHNLRGQARGACRGSPRLTTTALTVTSGPGMALKTEMLGLAIMAELPLVVVDVQRGGPSTGLPTKVEQGDLLVVPANLHHRFFLTDRKQIRCVRLFKDASGWVPHYRA